MSLTPNAPTMRNLQSLQILEDLKKIKVKIEESEVVETLNNTSQTVPGVIEPDLYEGEDAREPSSSSEMSELEDSGSDTALTSVKYGGSHLGIDEPQERSMRTRNVAKTYVEPDSSSEDVGERQRGRGIVVKNTFPLDLSQESDTDSTASYTSDSTEDSVEEQGTGPEFAKGKGEDGSELEYDSPGEQSDAVHTAERGEPSRRLRSAAGRKENSENVAKISQAKLKYMITHGTLNEMQRSKPWEVIAKECGVTASLEHIFRALKQAGVSYGDRLGLKPQVATTRDHDALSVIRSSSSQSSTSSTHDEGSATINLTPREWELIIVAYQSIKDGCQLKLDYKKLADLAGFNGSASAKAVWGRVRQKLGVDASLSRLTAREGQLLGLAFRSVKDGHTVEIDYDKFVELAGLSTTNSGRACWSALKKRLVAGSSSVKRKRKRPAYTIVPDCSESEDVIPTPKKRRRSTSTSSHYYHRSSDPHRSRSRKAINAQKPESRTTSHPFAVDRVEPTLRVSKEPLIPGTARNTRDMILPNGNPDDDNLPAASKKATQTTVATIAKETLGRGNAAASSSKNNISGRSTTSKTITKSAMQKTKNMVWNLESERSLLLAIVEVDGHKMNYEAVAERLGCTGNAVLQHLSKLQREIRSRNDRVPLVRSQILSWPIVWSNRPNPGAAAALESIVKPNDSTAHFGLPNATRTKDALFIKNEIAKLEANLGGDDELIPWTEQELSALEQGLRRFSGPFWKDILGLFGPTGSVSDVLKNRDEAQLEEKVCRMKISYLKNGVKFPFYLRMVTGGSKKAVPTVVVHDGEGDIFARGAEGHVKDTVAITSDEENRP